MNDILQIIGSIATIVGGITATIQLYLWGIEYSNSTNIDIIDQAGKSNNPSLEADVVPNTIRYSIKGFLATVDDSWIKGGGAIGLLIGGVIGNYLGSEISQQIFGGEVNLIRVIGIVLLALAGIIIGSIIGAILFRMLPVIFKLLLVMAAIYLIYYIF